MSLEPGNSLDRCPVCGGRISLGHARGSWCREFIEQQEPLGPEFEKVLQDNLWDLIVRSK